MISAARPKRSLPVCDCRPSPFVEPKRRNAGSFFLQSRFCLQSAPPRLPGARYRLMVLSQLPDRCWRRLEQARRIVQAPASTKQTLRNCNKTTTPPGRQRRRIHKPLFRQQSQPSYKSTLFHTNRHGKTLYRRRDLVARLWRVFDAAGLLP